MGVVKGALLVFQKDVFIELEKDDIVESSCNIVMDLL